MAAPEAPPAPVAEPVAEPVRQERQVVPQSVKARQLANPFLAPDYSAAPAAAAPPVRLLADWELIGPLLRSFETATPGATSCMELPEPSGAHIAPGLDLMPHQAQVVAAATSWPPYVPARGRARPGQDRAGAAGGTLREGVPAARRRAERRQDELGARGGDVDAGPSGDRHPQRRRDRRRLLRHRHRQLRHPQPARRLARHVRLPRDGHRRGALHQEQDLAALPQRPRPVAKGPAAHRRGRCSWR